MAIKNKTISINNDGIRLLAQHCHDIFTSTPSKETALSLVAEYIMKLLGDYLSPDMLTEPDELTMILFELLDQVVFEISENKKRNKTISEYIINDLYTRLNSFLEVFQGIDYYRSKLMKRNLQFEDTVIIKHLHLNEFADKLVLSFDEHPDLQKYIIKTLNTLEYYNALNFYYRVYGESTSDEVRIQLLIGLKKMSSRFKNWKGLKQITPELASLIEFVRSFDWEASGNSSPPSDIYIIYFLFHYIEANITTLHGYDNLERMLHHMKTIASIKEPESVFSTDIYRAFTNILFNMNNNDLRSVLNNTNILKDFIFILDTIPLDYFDRIKRKTSFAIHRYTGDIKSLFTSGSFTISPELSNTMNYLFLSSGNIL